ncbi:MAG: PPOX class F420-dependent oxidoreductase [Chloroflexota bacterium]
MMDFLTIGEQQYINLETFKKDGTGVKTPVWVVKENDRLFVWTQADSWKVKRIRRNEDVKLCKSDARGTPLSDWVSAKAKILDTQADITTLRGRMLKKYGMMFRLINLMGRLRGRSLDGIAGIELTQ